MPPDFPDEYVASLHTLEPLLRDIVKDALRDGAPTAYAASLGVSLDE